MEHKIEQYNYDNLPTNLLSVDADKFHQFIKMVEQMKDRLDELELKDRQYRENEYDLDYIIDRLRR